MTTTTEYKLEFPATTEIEEKIIQIAIESSYDDECTTNLIALTNTGRILVRALYRENQKWNVLFEGKLKVLGEN